MTLIIRLLAPRWVRGSLAILTTVLVVAAVARAQHLLPRGPTTQSGTQYVNLLLEVQFRLPAGFHVEDIAETDLIRLSPNNQAVANQSEADFFAAGGLTVKSLRYIPGSRKTFELFERREFEPLLSKDGREFTSRPFVTDQGYDAFRVSVTKPFPLTMIVVNSPVAYWLSARADSDTFRELYQSLTKLSDDRQTEVKQSVSSFENFLLALKDRSFAQVLEFVSPDFGTKLSAAELERQVTPVDHALQRPLKVVSIQLVDHQAFVRGVLEDETEHTYAFAGARLVRIDDRWLVDSFVVDKNRPGLPVEAILKHVRLIPNLQQPRSKPSLTP